MNNYPRNTETLKFKPQSYSQTLQRAFCNFSALT